MHAPRSRAHPSSFTSAVRKYNNNIQPLIIQKSVPLVRMSVHGRVNIFHDLLSHKIFNYIAIGVENVFGKLDLFIMKRSNKHSWYSLRL